MHTVTLHDAKTQLAQLVEQAARGEAFIISKSGRPMVKVIPFDTSSRTQRGLVLWQARFLSLKILTVWAVAISPHYLLEVRYEICCLIPTFCSGPPDNLTAFRRNAGPCCSTHQII